MTRLLVPAAAALALIASPALAQNAAELLGPYHMTMTSKSGDKCPDEDDEDLSIDIRRISGDKLIFGEVGREGDSETAQYDPTARSFRFEQAAVADSGQQSGVFTGQFTRQTDSVRLDMTIQIEGCTGKLTGFRPAPALAVAPGAAPTATSEAATGGPTATAAAPAAAAQPSAGMGAGQMALYGVAGLALLAAGVAIGWFVNRRRDAPPPAGPAAAPPPDKPESGA